RVAEALHEVDEDEGRGDERDVEEGGGEGGPAEAAGGVEGARRERGEAGEEDVGEDGARELHGDREVLGTLAEARAVDGHELFGEGDAEDDEDREEEEEAAGDLTEHAPCALDPFLLARLDVD